MSTAVSLAFAAGLLATVNPCGFALLPSFLSFYLGADAQADSGSLARVGQGFAVGLALTAGFSGVFIVAGLLVSAGLRLVLHALPWAAVAIGAALIVLGLLMVAGRRVSLLAAGRLRPDVAGTRGLRRVALFGVAYALASLSCTLAVFLVVVSQALTVGGVGQTLAVFAAYAAGSASILLALCVSAALTKGALTRLLRRSARSINRVAGALLTVSGGYLLTYWLPAVTSGHAASTGALARSSTRVSSALAAFFSSHTTLFAVALGVLAAVGLVAAVRRRFPTTPTPASDRRPA